MTSYSTSPADRPRQDVGIALTAGGVSVWLRITDSGMPVVLHWGAELPVPTADDLRAADEGSLMVRDQNGMDVPFRVSVLPETGTGYQGRPGLIGHRDSIAWSPRWRVTSVDVDGREPLDGLIVAGAGVVTVLAEDEEAHLQASIVLELLPSGLLRLRAVITNTGDETYDIALLVPRLPVPDRAVELLDFAGRWSDERRPQRLPFAVGTHLREARHGRTGADSAFVLHAGTAGFTFDAGEVWGVHVAWSGNHVHLAELTSAGQRHLGGGELPLPGEIALGHDESYASPWLYGTYGVGLDEAASRFHEYLRSRPQHPDPRRPVTLNVWEAVYFDHRVDRLIALADRAASIGVERFVLDDGWFGARRNDWAGLGDWVVSEDVYPDGLGPLVDHVTGLGMQFGLWFEPEMVNPDSDVAREHPEWVMQVPGRLPPEARHQQVLNLSIPDAYAHVRDQMVALLDAYDIAYIKWDHNRDLVEAGNLVEGGLASVHAQTLAVYRLMDELKAHRPGLEIESCSSGGARIDLAVMERCERVWVSDCSDPVERQRMHRWTTQLLPPEMLGSHVASAQSTTTGRTHELSFRAATALFGHFGIEWDLAHVSESELAELQTWIRVYKALRPLLFTGRVVRIDLSDPLAYFHGVVSSDRTRAVYSLAAADRPLTSTWGRLRFAGLDPDRRYRVRPHLPAHDLATEPGLQAPAWFGNAERDSYAGAEFTGAYLSRVGLQAPSMYPERALLFLVRAV